MDEAKVNKPVAKREVVSINNAVAVDTSAYSIVSYQMNNMSCKKCLKERAKDVSGSVALETSDFELPKGEELEQLARYTTGCPLIRYDCPPSECPQCQAELYSTQYYYGMYQDDFYKYSSHYEDGQSVTMETQSTKDKDCEMSSMSVDSVDIVTAESSDSKNTKNTPSEFQNNNTLSTAENNAQNNPERNPNIVCCSQSKTTSSTQTQRQLLDIDITTRRSSGGKFSRDTLCSDSVYIDLTDTDVTYTVYYDHDMSQSDKENSNYAITTDSYPTTSFSSSSSMSSSSSSLNQALSFTTTCYMPVPYWYWPYMYSPMHSLSFPSNYHPDSIPKKLMIPPEELRAFNTSQPPARQWMWLATPERNRPTAIYTVMCYNVLCDKYCTRQIYGYCPSWALNWEYRKKGIIEEIKHFAADIISLQEVETDQFYNFFKPELKAEGYDGIFSPKSRARTMTESDRKHVDGCAIFFRTSKFSLVKEHLIEFNQLAMANAEGSDDMLNRVMTKDNIGLAALLETKEGVYENGSPPEGQIKQPILVATAHIHWDPEFSDVKLIQTMMLMWELKQIISDCTQSFRPGSNISTQQDVNTIPLILCGDLNSLPDSDRYDFKGIIDYIFYSKDHMNLLGLLGPLEEEWFRQNKVVGCPHPHVASDHFSLLVEFEIPTQTLNGRSNNSSNHLKHR
ncbi:hypothetical protein KUTeg_003711 [Tegillarca granosa]|uniref:Endonuclease/exonuclease/phosphatase domain-containing protein n=1 Tax=Tegillarca granosa TaxID=220873 RepID=A0ABQ9FMX4_TEGGR|nr:hypothetical protein KUTeg_003711 [Tegillarca granosa]